MNKPARPAASAAQDVARSVAAAPLDDFFPDLLSEATPTRIRIIIVISSIDRYWCVIYIYIYIYAFVV